MCEIYCVFGQSNQKLNNPVGSSPKGEVSTLKYGTRVCPMKSFVISKYAKKNVQFTENFSADETSRN